MNKILDIILAIATICALCVLVYAMCEMRVYLIRWTIGLNVPDWVKILILGW